VTVLPVTLADVQAARARLAGVIPKTPCARSQALSERFDCELYLKLENLQMTGSFKDRGAFNAVALLTDEQRRAGVIAASAGNHAQGLAFAAQRAGVRATIVMPVATPLIKVTATRARGATIVLHGESFDDAAAEALRLSHEQGLVLVPPFDGDAVIAGQGTVGLEILEDVPGVDGVIVPVGGGGLAGGVGVALAALRPEVKLYGAQASAVPSMYTALEAGHPVLVPPARTLADGIAVRAVCPRTLALARAHLDQLVLVDEEEIAEAVLLLLEVEKTVAEGAGAAPLAALMSHALPLEGKTVVVVVSGGNIDVQILSRIIDRGLVKSGRLMRVRVLIPDVPGALAELLSEVAKVRANVLEVHHDRLASRSDPGLTTVELVLETRGFEHVAQVEGAITEHGWVVAV
jgi:threonine dehydratase